MIQTPEHKELQSKIANTEPGSQEEKAILGELRNLNSKPANETREHTAANLEQATGENRVITPDQAQKAHIAGLETTTASHEVVPSEKKLGETATKSSVEQPSELPEVAPQQAKRLPQEEHVEQDQAGVHPVVDTQNLQRNAEHMASQNQEPQV